MVASNDKPDVLLIWVDSAGEIQRKSMPWKRPMTREAVYGWMGEYLDRLNDGYRPDGFDEAPVPHCARVILRTVCVAEWKRPLTIAELVRLDSRKVG